MVFLIVNFLSFIAIVMIYLAIIFFDYKASSEQLVNIKLINFTAFLVSIYLILELLFDTIPILEMQKLFKIKINKFILVLIGIFCGGIHGFFSGLTVDLLGILLIKKITFINLFFTLGSIVSATLPYYLTCIFRKILVSDKIKYYHCAIISFTLTYFLISFSNPIVLKYCFFPRNPWLIFYTVRIFSFFPVVSINSWLLVVVYKRLEKYLGIKNEKIYHLKLVNSKQIYHKIVLNDKN